MILEPLKVDLNEALKARDEIRVSVLRFLLSAIHNQEIKKQQELSDEEVTAVIQKQTKERRESIEAFQKGGREDLMKKEEAELDILSKYLPQQLSEEEVKNLVTEVIRETGAGSPADFGLVMGAVMGKVKGRADGQLVASLVKEVLGG